MKLKFKLKRSKVKFLKLIKKNKNLYVRFTLKYEKMIL